MSWQQELLRQTRESQERRASVELWWIVFDEPRTRIWATTPEDGDGWSLCAFARSLYGMGVGFSARDTTQAGVACVELATSVGHLVVDEQDMETVMRSLRRFGVHGRYRKAGTEREYEF